MKLKKSEPWDRSEFLETDEDAVAYLNAALEDGNQGFINAVLGDIAHAKAMTH